MSLLTVPAEPDGIERLYVALDYPSKDVVVRIVWTFPDRARYVAESVITTSLLGDETAAYLALDLLVNSILTEHAPRIPGLAFAPYVVQLLIPETYR